MADERGTGADLRRALASTTLAACVGPVTDEAAAAAGFARRCAPARGRLGLLVRALCDDLHPRHRHLRTGDGEVLVHGAWVSGGDHPVTLTGLERMLLATLAERPGVAVSRPALRRRVWGGRCHDSAIDTALSRLRRALRPVGLRLQVVQRRGWALHATGVPCPAPSRQATAVTGASPSPPPSPGAASGPSRGPASGAVAGRPIHE